MRGKSRGQRTKGGSKRTTMEGVDLYGDLDDPFFFKDKLTEPSNQVN